MNRKYFVVAVLVVIAALAIGGCGSSSSSSSSAVKAYSQSLVDADVMWGVNKEMVSLYNNNFAGKPTGAQNKTASCPLGGTVQITGTTTFDNVNLITNVDLYYNMSNCQFTSAGGTLTVSLTMNGTMHHSGNFKSSGYKDENYIAETAPGTATNVSIVGTSNRTGYLEASVNENCTYNSHSTLNGTSGAVTGQICGRSVSWTY